MVLCRREKTIGISTTEVRALWNESVQLDISWETLFYCSFINST